MVSDKNKKAVGNGGCEKHIRARVSAEKARFSRDRVRRGREIPELAL